MGGKVPLRRVSLLQTTLVIYSAVWEVCLILVLGPCLMITQSRRGVRKEGTPREGMHKSGLDFAEKSDIICKHKECMSR